MPFFFRTLRFVLVATLLAVAMLWPATAALAQDPAAPAVEEKGLAARIDDFLEPFNDWWSANINPPLKAVLFYPVLKTSGTFRGDPTAIVELPLVIIVLLVGGVFFTFRYGFVNIRMFKHGVHLVMGKYDHADDPGEVSHFQALSSALAGTVGLGNIAGVAVAISMGGPGAVFWMAFTAFFGMSMKCSEVILAHAYRRVNADGRVLGGPMIYLYEGIKETIPALAPVGRVFAVVYGLFVVPAAFASGNMFQANQAVSLFSMTFFPDSSNELFWKFIMGCVMAGLTAVVIIGGVKRIGEVASRLVPFMCLFFSGVSLTLLFKNYTLIPEMVGSIFTGAFNADAMFGGFVGVLVQGTRRAAFSNEAGLGSAAIVHSAARTKEPVREGLVALLEPFIDTIVMCTMTALAILATGAHLSSAHEGIGIAREAFSQLGWFADYGLSISVFTFAWATMLGWGYYGERGVEYLLGTRGIVPYRVMYCLVICIAPLLSIDAVIDFADMLLFSLAFPNILGMVLLSGKVNSMIKDYVRRFKAGEMQMTK